MPVAAGWDWGVSVEQVSALAPHIPISNAGTPALPADPAYGDANERTITRGEVEAWIKNVSAILGGRILRASKLPDTHPYFAYLEVAAATCITSGAAHYLVAAAFPLKAATNDQTSYAEVLRLRFEEGLDEIKAALDGAIADGLEDGAIAARPAALLWSFPPSRFPDGQVF